ncbi:MAG: amidohydrolase family protein [Deltaproteobacteria bacterium]|nr:amidohydrolase family protein [Deltaproteobacteria bacterium]
MPRTLSALLCLLLSTGASAELLGGSLVLRCGRVIDGVSPRVRRDIAIVIRDGRITDVGRIPRSARKLPTLDLREHTCLPGLIDLHTHLTDRPQDTADLRVYFTRTREEQLPLARENAAATLAAGFTSVRNVGTYVDGYDREMRDAIARGEYPGPRMQVSSPYLTIPGGGGDLRLPDVAEGDIPARVRMGVARGPELFRARAERALSLGADLVKVIASGAVLAFGNEPGAPEMTPEELRAVVEVALARGARVAAHAHGARSIREAILAGASTIEHASLIDDEGIRLAREHGVVLVMDVYNGDYIDSEGRAQGWPADFLRKNLDTTEAQRQAFTRALTAGATIAFGTDAGVFPHGQNARQFRVMVARGMTPLQAIQSATSVAARAMGWEDRVGALAPGRFGDVIALRGDPLSDITRLERLEVVVQGGIVKRAPAR